MRMYDIIRHKRDGMALSREEIDWFISGYTRGKIPEYQAAALCMAIYFRGMTDEETLWLTLAIRDSGEMMDTSRIRGIRVDKHSTGGVGDKTSLVVAPIVASLGLKVAKMSGRGLGHTGGTVDKLESIPGFRTDLSPSEFTDTVNQVGVAIVGQNHDLAPADKKLYALRDVTATVDSLPLIASSIMGKKLAANDDCILLDVKCGSGAFMKTPDESRELARCMVRIGQGAGKRIRALITDMDTPLGFAIGNALEVQEAIDTLNGRGPEDFTRLCTELSAHLVSLANLTPLDESRRAVQHVLESGEALRTLTRMVAAQGGNPACIAQPSLLPRSSCSCKVLSPCDGYIGKVNAEAYGSLALALGAGRNTLEDPIDPGAGILLHAKTGMYIRTGEPLATLYTERKEVLADATERFLGATAFCHTPPPLSPLILDVIDGDGDAPVS